MLLDRYLRQQDIISPTELDIPITVIGLGGIGSPTTYLLAKMGCSDLTLYDGDTVEDHNLPNQFYGLSDIGHNKVFALTHRIHHDLDITVKPMTRHFNNSPVGEIVISCVDSMATRQAIWQHVKKQSDVGLYLEARMGGEMCRIYTIKNPYYEDTAWYEDMLYTDDNALPLPCTARATIYTGTLIASLLTYQVKCYAKSQDVSKEIIFDFVTSTFIVQ